MFWDFAMGVRSPVAKMRAATILFIGVMENVRPEKIGVRRRRCKEANAQPGTDPGVTLFFAGERGRKRGKDRYVQDAVPSNEVGSATRPTIDVPLCSFVIRAHLCTQNLHLCPSV